jgi:phospholipid/cholesterol/gamma-HCH transport system substrate-binding protein
MKEITNNFTVVSQNLTSTSKNIDEMVGTINSGQGSLGKLVTDETLYNSMVDFMESARLVMDRINGDGTLGLLMSDSTLYYNLADTTKNLKVITDELASGKGTLGHLLTDEELYANLKETIQSANRAAQGLEEQTPISVMGTILGLVW